METYNSIEVTKQLVKDGKISQEIAEAIFPELKSEDEEMIEIIRGAIFTATMDETTRRDALSWLEKQGEQNQITFNDAHIIDSALNDYCCKQYGALHKENGGVLSFARLQHLAMDIYGWCEKQILANSAKTCKDEQKSADKVEPIEGEFPYDNPADTLEGEIDNIWRKVSCDNRFSATKEGFEEVIHHFINFVRQKTAWSEEDEKMFEFWNLYYEHKVGDMPNKDVVENLEKFQNWLKSLKPPYYCDNCKLKKSIQGWKPSDEQMEALDDFIYAKYPNIEKHGAAVKSLYQDLKKLKG